VQTLVVVAAQVGPLGVFGRRTRGVVIGCQRQVPKTQPREDVRRHVLGVRGIGRRLGIGLRCIESQVRQSRKIVAVDQVVQHAGVRRVRAAHPVQQGRRLELMVVGLVSRIRARQQRQSIEHGRFRIVQVVSVHVAHVRFELAHPRTMAGGVGTRKEGSERVEERRLARSGRQTVRSLEERASALEAGLAGRRPERMPDAHRRTPVGHGAGRVIVDDLGEQPRRLRILERVQKSDRVIELRLYFGGARVAEMNRRGLGCDRLPGRERRAEQNRDDNGSGRSELTKSDHVDCLQLFRCGERPARVESSGADKRRGTKTTDLVSFLDRPRCAVSG